MAAISKDIRTLTLTRDGFVCQKCSTKGSDDNPLTIHHIKPKHLDGKNDLDNLVTLCQKCHRMYHMIYGADAYVAW